MKRVLIVDDSLELGRWLQTALTQMDAQIQIAVFPSGEEALLDSSRRPVDVLVTDIRLAGISGLDLVRKIRKRYPGIRVVVITGVQDMSLEKQAKELGIDAFFRKPMNIPSFLEAVNACLKVESGQTAPPVPPPPPAPPPQPRPARPETPPAMLVPSETHAPAAISSLTVLLSGLRQDLGALAVLLLNENGQVVAKSGSFPDSSFENRWSESLMETVHASIKVSKLLETPQSRNLVALQGLAFDLVLSPVGPYALVLALRTGRPTLRLALAFEEILNIQKNLLALAPTQAPAAPRPEAKPSLPPSTPVQESGAAAALKTEPIAPPAAPLAPQLADEPPSEEFAALFHQQSSLDSENVEAFWKTAAAASGAPLPPGSESITYEQARKMGLAPGLDEEEPS
jgi:DNA-binding response OmpR family regulator